MFQQLPDHQRVNAASFQTLSALLDWGPTGPQMGCCICPPLIFFIKIYICLFFLTIPPAFTHLRQDRPFSSPSIEFHFSPPLPQTHVFSFRRGREPAICATLGFLYRRCLPHPPVLAHLTIDNGWWGGISGSKKFVWKKFL